MGWRFYAQRAGSGLWLDTNVQLQSPELTWSLSAPNSGKAIIPIGANRNPDAQDNRRVWGKWDTILYAEEDGDLAWAGICTAANPDDKGLSLEFIGPWGWMQGIPFNAIYRSWKVNAFDVVRMLINHSKQYKPNLEFAVNGGDSQFFVGDVDPPPKPKPPHRRKNETKTEFQGSDRYDEYQRDIKEWNNKYGDREQYEVAYYEAPYVGEEIDTLAKELMFDYREGVTWRNKSNLTPEFDVEFKDNLRTRRDDIAFVDGMNIAKALDPKDGAEMFAQHVIALGAGEGRKMKKAQAGGDDDRLYQARFVQYKSVRKIERLRALAQAEQRVLSNTSPKIDQVEVWDVPGYASTSTLRVGNEVQVLSENTIPPLDLWVRVTKITRNTSESTTVVGVETVG